jgi:hypothetical protein
MPAMGVDFALPFGAALADVDGDARTDIVRARRHPRRPAHAPAGCACDRLCGYDLGSLRGRFGRTGTLPAMPPLSARPPKQR